METRATRWMFEGEELTVAQIRQRVPILSDRTIRKHLAAGRDTRQAMLNFDISAASARGGRKAARRAKADGLYATFRSSSPSACHV